MHHRHSNLLQATPGGVLQAVAVQLNCLLPHAHCAAHTAESQSLECQSGCSQWLPAPLPPPPLPLAPQLHRLLEMVVHGAEESGSIQTSRIFPSAVGAEFERALSSTPPGQCSDILNWLCGRVEEVCVRPLSTLTSAEGETTTWRHIGHEGLYQLQS